MFLKTSLQCRERQVDKGMKRAKSDGGSATTAEKLVDAAVELFAANGFNATSIRDIARLTGMTISNIYYHYGSKEGLLVAILERTTRQIVDGLREVTDRDMDPLERFKLLLKAHFDLLINIGRREANILFLEEEHVSRFRKPFQIELLDIYRKELQNLKSFGYVSQENVTVLAFNIFGVINWHLRWYKPEGKMTLDQVEDEMVTFILHGMSGPPPSAERPPT
jgi:TetR/AcrR family transcriptional regulator, cholesterol catabolism regulator